MNDIKNHVESIADDLTNGVILNTDEHDYIMEENEQEPGEMMYASDYLSDALDIEYIVNGEKEYLGARVLVAFGGPNIWINTRNNTVEGAWWMDTATATFTDTMGLDEFLEEMYNC